MEDESSVGEDQEIIEEEQEQEEAETAAGEVRHVYYEVGNDLLAKPNALVDLLQINAGAGSVIFCNTPSEADMVSVMLGKKGISATKLIGNIPFAKVAAAIEHVQQGQLDAIVITDVAARDMEVGDFAMVINYSIHEDPEIYLHRHSGAETAATDTMVASLVSPLDFGNFHYLKKVVDFEIEKEELPSQAELVEARSNSFFEAAVSVEDEVVERYASYVEKILEHDDRNKVLSYLLHSTLEALPAAQASSSSNRGGGRDRGERDNRRDRDYSDRREGRSNRGNRHENNRQRDRNYVPPKKDVRIYLGHGSEQNFSEDEFATLIEGCGEGSTEELIKRFSIREHYAYADIPEEIAEDVLETLKSASLSDGTELFFRKATTITVAREEAKEQAQEASTDTDGETSAEAEEEGSEELEATSDEELQEESTA